MLSLDVHSFQSLCAFVFLAHTSRLYLEVLKRPIVLLNLRAIPLSHLHTITTARQEAFCHTQGSLHIGGRVITILYLFPQRQMCLWFLSIQFRMHYMHIFLWKTAVSLGADKIFLRLWTAIFISPPFAFHSIPASLKGTDINIWRKRFALRRVQKQSSAS